MMKIGMISIGHEQKKELGQMTFFSEQGKRRKRGEDEENEREGERRISRIDTYTGFDLKIRSTLLFVYYIDSSTYCSYEPVSLLNILLLVVLKKNTFQSSPLGGVYFRGQRN